MRLKMWRHGALLAVLALLGPRSGPLMGAYGEVASDARAASKELHALMLHDTRGLDRGEAQPLMQPMATSPGSHHGGDTTTIADADPGAIAARHQPQLHAVHEQLAKGVRQSQSLQQAVLRLQTETNPRTGRAYWTGAQADAYVAAIDSSVSQHLCQIIGTHAEHMAAGGVNPVALLNAEVREVYSQQATVHLSHAASEHLASALQKDPAFANDAAAQALLRTSTAASTAASTAPLAAPGISLARQLRLAVATAMIASLHVYAPITPELATKMALATAVAPPTASPPLASTFSAHQARHGVHLERRGVFDDILHGVKRRTAAQVPGGWPNQEHSGPLAAVGDASALPGSSIVPDELLNRYQRLFGVSSHPSDHAHEGHSVGVDVSTGRKTTSTPITAAGSALYEGGVISTVNTAGPDVAAFGSKAVEEMRIPVITRSTAHSLSKWFAAMQRVPTPKSSSATTAADWLNEILITTPGNVPKPSIDDLAVYLVETDYSIAGKKSCLEKLEKQFPPAQALESELRRKLFDEFKEKIQAEIGLLKSELPLAISDLRSNLERFSQDKATLVQQKEIITLSHPGHHTGIPPGITPRLIIEHAPMLMDHLEFGLNLVRERELFRKGVIHNGVIDWLADILYVSTQENILHPEWNLKLPKELTEYFFDKKLDHIRCVVSNIFLDAELLVKSASTYGIKPELKNIYDGLRERMMTILEAQVTALPTSLQLLELHLKHCEEVANEEWVSHPFPPPSKRIEAHTTEINGPRRDAPGNNSGLIEPPPAAPGPDADAVKTGHPAAEPATGRSKPHKSGNARPAGAPGVTKYATADSAAVARTAVSDLAEDKAVWSLKGICIVAGVALVLVAIVLLYVHAHAVPSSTRQVHQHPSPPSVARDKHRLRRRNMR